VTDPSGGVIAGVKVEATNVETNVVFSVRRTATDCTTFRTFRRGPIE
jgi:hypothetical protein